MKKIFLVLIAFTMSSCTPVAERVMPPLQYTKPISFHSSKDAYLLWQSGAKLAYNEHLIIGPGADPVAALLVTAVDSQNRKANPGHYIFSYGDAQQVVFMTSLKNILIQHNVFKSTKLITETKTLKSNDALIIVKFRSTRMTGTDFVLIVDLSIQAPNHKPFNRSYVVQNRPFEKQFAVRTYVELQTDVSEQLLEKILSGIQEWNLQLKRGN